MGLATVLSPVSTFLDPLNVPKLTVGDAYGLAHGVGYHARNISSDIRNECRFRKKMDSGFFNSVKEQTSNRKNP